MKYPCESWNIYAAAASPTGNPVLSGWVLVAAILGSSLAFIDGTVVNVALPNIQHALNTTVSGAQWVVESYALFLAALILLGGTLGDFYGRRLIFTIGVFLFAAASAWCGFAPDIRHLIAARALQGVGGAMLVPGSLAIISAAFPADKRGKAIGTWSGFTGITAAIGPVLGGWLCSISPGAGSSSSIFRSLRRSLGFASCLFLKVVVKPANISSIFRRIPDYPWPGLLVFGMIEAPALGWTNPVTWGTATAGVLAIALFLWRESEQILPCFRCAFFGP